MKNEQKKEKKHTGDAEDLPGYPEYPDKEDIYRKYKEERDIRPDYTGNPKMPPDSKGPNEKDFEDVKSGEDLDVPGTDLDYDPGSEDEENSYYSLGGDDHDDLEESRNG